VSPCACRTRPPPTLAPPRQGPPAARPGGLGGDRRLRPVVGRQPRERGLGATLTSHDRHWPSWPSAFVAWPRVDPCSRGWCYSGGSVSMRSPGRRRGLAGGGAGWTS
jgi:hypothetical protein